jgi:hypothetical protein
MGINLINMRERFIKLFNKKIILLERNKSFIDNIYQLFFFNLLYYVGCKQLLKYYKYNLIYKLDNLIFYEDYEKKIHLTNSIILSSEICVPPYNKNKKYTYELILKHYSKNIPIYIIMKLENLKQDMTIKLNIFSNKTTKTLEYNLHDIYDKKLYEIL